MFSFFYTAKQPTPLYGHVIFYAWLVLSYQNLCMVMLRLWNLLGENVHGGGDVLGLRDQVRYKPRFHQGEKVIHV